MLQSNKKKSFTLEIFSKLNHFANLGKNIKAELLFYNLINFHLKKVTL